MVPLIKTKVLPPLLFIWQAGPYQQGVHSQPSGPKPTPDSVNTFLTWSWRDFLNS